MNQEQQQKQIKSLIAKGKEQGFLTYHEVNDHLPDDIVEPEKIESIITMINDMGIAVHEFAPDADSLLITEAPMADEEAAEEAAAVLADVDGELGRTTDPIRMYMREMGSVNLLTRQDEINIAKRIEEGLSQALSALATHPDIITAFLQYYDKIETEEIKLSDMITGFTDYVSPIPKSEINLDNINNITPLDDIAQVIDEDNDDEDDDEDDDEVAATFFEENSLEQETARLRFAHLRELHTRLI